MPLDQASPGMLEALQVKVRTIHLPVGMAGDLPEFDPAAPSNPVRALDIGQGEGVMALRNCGGDNREGAAASCL
jgi:hypothetical protein